MLARSRPRRSDRLKISSGEGWRLGGASPNHFSGVGRYAVESSLLWCGRSVRDDVGCGAECPLRASARPAQHPASAPSAIPREHLAKAEPAPAGDFSGHKLPSLHRQLALADEPTTTAQIRHIATNRRNGSALFPGRWVRTFEVDHLVYPTRQQAHASAKRRI